MVLSGVSFQSAYLVSRFRFSHAIGQIGTGAGLSWQETKLTSLSLPPTMPHTLCLPTARSTHGRSGCRCDGLGRHSTNKHRFEDLSYCAATLTLSSLALAELLVFYAGRHTDMAVAVPQTILR